MRVAKRTEATENNSDAQGTSGLLRPAVQETDEQESGVPYDRGWAWMVVLGCFLNYVLVNGCNKSTGVIFVELRRQFQAPASQTALLFALKAGVFSIGGLYVMNVVVSRLGCRRTALIGAVFLSLSGILASLATDITAIIFLQSTLLGLSDVMVLTPGDVLMASYFRRRRSLAISIAKCGTSIGSLAMPQLVTFLLQHYGLYGGLLLIGGVCLHALPATLLMRPTSYFTRTGKDRKGELLKPSPGQTSGEDTEDLKERRQKILEDLSEGGTRAESEKLLGNITKQNDAQSENLQRNVTKRCDRESSVNVIDASEKRVEIRDDENHPEIFEKLDISDSIRQTPDIPQGGNKDDENVPSISESITGSDVCSKSPDRGSWEESKLYSVSQEKSTESLNTASAKPQIPSVVYNEELDIAIHNARDITNTTDDHYRHQDDQKLFQVERFDKTSQNVATNNGSRASRLLQSVCILDFSLFRRPLFCLLFVYFMLWQAVNVTVDYLPALASENGLSESQAALLLSVIGGLDVVSRLGSGLLADRKIVRVPTMIIASFLVLGTCNQLVRFVTSFGHFLALAVLQGLLGGVSNCMLAILVLEFVGLDNMGKGMGFYMLGSGSFMAGFYPLLGYIRDVTGSYVIVYHVVGGGMLLAAGLLCLEGVVRRFEAKQNYRACTQHSSDATNVSMK